VHHRSRLADGRAVTLELVRGITREELGKIRAEVGEPAFATGHYEHAARLVDELTARDAFETFLTLTAYREID
jgi:malate synthase